MTSPAPAGWRAVLTRWLTRLARALGYEPLPAVGEYLAENRGRIAEQEFWRKELPRRARQNESD